MQTLGIMQYMESYFGEETGYSMQRILDRHTVQNMQKSMH